MATVNVGHLNRGQQLVVRRIIAIELHQITRSRQAADLGGHNAIDTALHPRTLLSNPLLPEITGRELGAVGECLELRPCDLWMDSSTEAAVGAGNHIFAADDLCKTHYQIRD